MSRKSIAIWTTVLCLLILCELTLGEIHRAKVQSKTKQSYRTKKFSHEVYDGEVVDGSDADVEWTFLGHTQETWVLAVLSAILVGLSGIFPLLVIPLDAGKALQKGASSEKLNLLLSFAVGGLLGDVFLHLLPEAWAHVQGHDHGAHTKIGLWIIAGMMVFLLIEKVFPEGADEEGEEESTDRVITSNGTKLEEFHRNGDARLRRSPRTITNNNDIKQNGTFNGKVEQNGKTRVNGVQNGNHANGKVHRDSNELSKSSTNDCRSSWEQIKTSGWLNLLANFIDNFTHGLAVAGSYCVDTKTGLITTAAILLHEIPHEIGDFAILLRAGFDRWRAAKAQFITAFGGLLGAVVALTAESAQQAGDSTAWVLPFTSGGFIYIALVNVLPDLIKEDGGWNSFKQILFLCSGIAVMACVTLLC